MRQRVGLDQAPDRPALAGEREHAQSQRAAADLEDILALDQSGNPGRLELAPEFRLLGTGPEQLMEVHLLPEAQLGVLRLPPSFRCYRRRHRHRPSTAKAQPSRCTPRDQRRLRRPDLLGSTARRVLG